MSDRVERACTQCGSLLHHESDCTVTAEKERDEVRKEEQTWSEHELAKMQAERDAAISRVKENEAKFCRITYILHSEREATGSFNRHMGRQQDALLAEIERLRAVEQAVRREHEGHFVGPATRKALAALAAFDEAKKK